jgi:hypothetical protein
MRKSNALAMLLIGSLSAIVSCGHVTVKDKEVCADLGGAGAECAHTYIVKRRSLTKPQWDRERVGYMCMRSDSFSDGEDSLDELCRNTNLCDYETQDQINAFKARMLPVLKKARSARRASITEGELNDQGTSEGRHY